VAPLVQALTEAENKHAASSADVAAAVERLAQRQAALDALQEKYGAALAKRRSVERAADETRRRMTAADALINGLAGERARWENQLSELEETVRRLVGDVGIAAGFVAYGGPFGQAARDALVKTSLIRGMASARVPLTPEFAVRAFMTDESQVGEWALQELPGDELSVQNAILVSSTPRFPLLIDPQGQGRRWIENRERAAGLRVVTQTDRLFRQSLEECIDRGEPLLIVDVDEDLDPVLDPVLDKLLVKSGTTYKVMVGDKEIDWHPDFRLYITTKLANPAFSPELSARCCVIDFTVTLAGLEQQLLNRVVSMEREQLEIERSQLVAELTANRRKVRDLEAELLQRLSDATGSLVDDDELIEVLRVTKETTESTLNKMRIAREKEIQLNRAREEFRPAATRGSIVYFVVKEMSLVNAMYQVSLDQFLKLFETAIELSEPEPSSIVARRVEAIVEFSTFFLYKFVSRGLFENDKMVFLLQLALRFELAAREISQTALDTFLKGAGALDIASARPNRHAWLPDRSWLNLIQCAATCPALCRIADEWDTAGIQVWKPWYDLSAPETAPIPGGYDGNQRSLSPFERLLLVRAAREDRAMPAARLYVAETLGEVYIEPVPLDFEATWGESDARTPLICLLSPGADPTSQLEALARRLKVPLAQVSMGQGQEVHARRLLKAAAVTGGWVLLQNCHLALGFMRELEEYVRETKGLNEAFRVWITTDPIDRFPIGLLQMSIKLTNEPPKGVRAGLTQTFAWVNQDLLDAVEEKPIWRPLVYSLCFLHTTLQERRKFGPLGWNIPYEFNLSDLSASVEFLKKHFYTSDSNAEISWSTVRYMICEVQYGGRITDDFDRVLMNTYGNLWLNDDIAKPGFTFHAGYRVPDCRTLADLRASVDELPHGDSPEIFGMHGNADIIYRTRETATVLQTIVSMQPKGGAGAGGRTREDVVLEVAAGLVGRVPPDFDMLALKHRVDRLGGPTEPMNVFLVHEVHSMQNVISRVRESLEDLQLAIQGTVVMNEQLVQVMNALFDARVPPAWEAISWPSSSLGFWFSDVVARHAQYSAWLDSGRPDVFWMSGFFNPQAFVTSMLQETARAPQNQGKWSIDALQIRTELLRAERGDITAPPLEGVYIHGLYLEGAAWDRKQSRLIDAAPKAVHVPLPVVHLSAIGMSGGRNLRNFLCPVYRTPQRTDLTYIMSIDLRTDDAPSKWILRGTAVLANITT
jgi:dynein heavy chain